MNHFMIRAVVVSALSALLATTAMAQKQSDDLDALLGFDEKKPTAPGAEAKSEAMQSGSASEEQGDRGDAASPQPYDDSIAVESGSEELPEPAAPRQRTSRFIEEIIVTAQKREENLQDVPISVSAFSGDKLDALGVTDAKSLELVTSGFVHSELVGYSITYIRGVGTDAFLPSADTSVATYLDGVYLPFAHALASDFTKLERIEVLKGPQGTLFGRNTTGGAINIVTVQPSDTLEGAVDLDASNYDTRKLKAYVSGPLYGGLSGSASIIYSTADSYYKLLDSSVIRAVPTNETKGANIRLRWQATDTLSFMASGLRTRFEGGSVVTTQERPKPILAAFSPAPQGAYEASYNEPQFLIADNELSYGQILWRPDPLDIKVLASYQKVKTDTGYDYDATEEPLAYFHASNQFARVVTSELQLSSKDGGWLSDWLQWTTGLYYLKSDAGFDPLYFGANGTSADPGTGVTLVLRGAVATQAWAGYGQTTWRPLDWFGLTLGGRYQVEDRGLTKASSALADPVGGEIPLNSFPLESTTTRNFSPKVSLEFRPFDSDTLIYSSWQKGFKSGTYNVIAISNPPDYVKPESVTAIELGLKGTLFNGSLQYSAAIFENRLHDLQVQITSTQSGGATTMLNAAEVSTKGAELDLTWQMFPEALPGFVLTANGSYLRGLYDSFPEGSGYDEQSGLYFGHNSLNGNPPRDFSGNESLRTPKFSATLGPTYAFDVPGGTIELSVSGSYNSGYFYDTQNTLRQPKYKVLNARASYLYEPLGLRLSAFGRNLTDEVYYYDRINNDFGVSGYFAPPLTYGLTVGWAFQGS